MRLMVTNWGQLEHSIDARTSVSVLNGLVHVDLAPLHPPPPRQTLVLG